MLGKDEFIKEINKRIEEYVYLEYWEGVPINVLAMELFNKIKNDYLHSGFLKD